MALKPLVSLMSRELLDRLNIIASLAPGQRLDTTRAKLDIFHNRWSAWIQRTLYGDGRIAAVVTLDAIVGTAAEIVHMLAGYVASRRDTTEPANRYDRQDLDSNLHMLQAIGDSLTRAADGVTSLKETYSADALTVVQLERIRRELVELATHADTSSER